MIAVIITPVPAISPKSEKPLKSAITRIYKAAAIVNALVAEAEPE